MATSKTKSELREAQAAEAARAEAEFRAGLPVRILSLVAECDELNINYRLKLGPELVVSHTDHEAGEYCERTITLGSDVWDVDSLEYDLKDIRRRRETRRARTERASAILKLLNKEDLEVVVEYVLANYSK